MVRLDFPGIRAIGVKSWEKPRKNHDHSESSPRCLNAVNPAVALSAIKNQVPGQTPFRKLSGDWQREIWQLLAAFGREKRLLHVRTYILAIIARVIIPRGRGVAPLAGYLPPARDVLQVPAAANRTSIKWRLGKHSTEVILYALLSESSSSPISHEKFR